MAAGDDASCSGTTANRTTNTRRASRSRTTNSTERIDEHPHELRRRRRSRRVEEARRQDGASAKASREGEEALNAPLPRGRVHRRVGCRARRDLRRGRHARAHAARLSLPAAAARDGAGRRARDHAARSRSSPKPAPAPARRSRTSCPRCSTAARSSSRPAPRRCRTSSSSATCRWCATRSPSPITVALLKGRANYVCHHHLERTAREGRLPTRDDARHLPKIVAFARASERGDRAELADVPENAPIWPHGHVDARQLPRQQLRVLPRLLRDEGAQGRARRRRRRRQPPPVLRRRGAARRRRRRAAARVQHGDPRRGAPAARHGDAVLRRADHRRAARRARARRAKRSRRTELRDVARAARRRRRARAADRASCGSLPARRRASSPQAAVAARPRFRRSARRARRRRSIGSRAEMQLVRRAQRGHRRRARGAPRQRPTRARALAGRLAAATTTPTEWIRWVDVGAAGLAAARVAAVGRRRLPHARSSDRPRVDLHLGDARGRRATSRTSRAQLGLADAATGCWDSPFDYRDAGAALRAARTAGAEQRSSTRTPSSTPRCRC